MSLVNISRCYVNEAFQASEEEKKEENESEDGQDLDMCKSKISTTSKEHRYANRGQKSPGSMEKQYTYHMIVDRHRKGMIENDWLQYCGTINNPNKVFNSHETLTQGFKF